jgi:aquaporin related protein
MNPIRSLAPCIVNRSFPEYLWIYFVGPISGVILAVLVYKLVKVLEYETARDQDPTPALLLPLAKDDDRPSSLIPMASVHSGPPSEQDSSPAKTPDLQLQAPPNAHSKTVSFDS